MRSDLFPGGVGFVIEQFIHDGSLLFTGAAAFGGTHGLDGDVMGRSVQPTRQHRVVYQLRCASGQGDKRRLGHVFRKMGITNHPQRCGVDPVHVPPNQFSEGVLRALIRVGSQQVCVDRCVHPLHVSRDPKNRTVWPLTYLANPINGWVRILCQSRPWTLCPQRQFWPKWADLKQLNGR